MSWMRHCPLCGNSEFVDFNGRKGVKCGRCSSLERTRLEFAVLNRIGCLRPKIDVLHFAPEPALGSRLRALSNRYVSADFDPKRYHKLFPDTVRIDLCNDSLEEYRGGFDLILHNHVLEHLPCNVVDVLRRLLACLKPTGLMMFTMPIREGADTVEDFDPTLTAEERTRRFGQYDHVRMFGGNDVVQLVAKAGNIAPVNLLDRFLPAELKAIGVDLPTGVRGSVFIGRPSA
jgi:hypothetical protein